jgi:hypothetical protein
MVVPGGVAPSPHQHSESEGELGGVGATTGSGKRGRANPEQVGQRDPAGESERRGSRRPLTPGTGEDFTGAGSVLISNWAPAGPLNRQPLYGEEKAWLECKCLGIMNERDLPCRSH